MGKPYLILDNDKVSLPKWNIKRTDRALYNKLKNSLKQNGQLQLLTVRKIAEHEYEIVDGRKRFKIAKELNLNNLTYRNLGEISEDEAIKHYLELTLSFDINNIEVAKCIVALTNKYQINELDLTLPYGLQELINYSKLLDFDWDQFKEEDAPVETQEEIWEQLGEEAKETTTKNIVEEKPQEDDKVTEKRLKATIDESYEKLKEIEEETQTTEKGEEDDEDPLLY